MIKKNRVVILLTVLLGLTVAGNVNSSSNSDFIRIINITPNSNLMDGTNQQFTVTVEYGLFTKEDGIVYVGFNSYKPDMYTLMGNLIIKRGTGVHTFNVTALTKDWQSSAMFGVYVNISPYPHEKRWRPLVYAIKNLSF
jgi:hypothetical protein